MPALKYMHVNNNKAHGIICCLFPDSSVVYAVLDASIFSSVFETSWKPIGNGAPGRKPQYLYKSHVLYFIL